MPKKKRRSKVERATKLAQVNDLASQGKSQSEIGDRSAAGAPELLNSSSKILGCANGRLI
jgi:hypothetical protein